MTGAGGFIGHHLVSYLVDNGYWVRGADIRHPQYQESRAHEFYVCDLRQMDNCIRCAGGVSEVYNLAANMGGIGYITANKAIIVRDNTLIDMQMIEAAVQSGVNRYLYASSACVYPIHIQQNSTVEPLKEDDAYPADPEDGYGWEKLFMERTCRHYSEDFGLKTRVARLHNIYGPYGQYDGGREKSPAALCRKAILASDGAEIEIWGDGEQTRSYCYIADCIEGLHRLMRSEHRDPINIGQTQSVSINQLANIIINIAGKRLHKRHDTSKPQGVRGRSSDNTTLRRSLGWEPKIPLEVGLSRTFHWIVGQLGNGTAEGEFFVSAW